MRTKLLILACLSLLAYTVFVAPTFAQQFRPDFCPNKDGTYYQPNLFPRLRGNNFRLVLADWTTGKEVRVLDKELTYNFDFSWSPDCHYLVGHSIGYNSFQNDYSFCYPGLIIWDAVTGGRKFSANGFCDTIGDGYPHVFWRQDSAAVLLSEWLEGWNQQGSTGSRIIWYPASGQQIQLRMTGIQPNFFQIYWDDVRGWLWGSSDDGLTAFDVHTGAQVISFENPPPNSESSHYYWHTASYFRFSPDGTHIILSGQHLFEGSMSPAMSVYEIASGVGEAVNVELNGAGVVAMSPDNRYVVMGYTALRVWDLSNLPEKVEDRLPIRRINTGSFIDDVHFVDNTTAEVSNGEETSRWNVATGQRMS